MGNLSWHCQRQVYFGAIGMFRSLEFEDLNSTGGDYAQLFKFIIIGDEAENHILIVASLPGVGTLLGGSQVAASNKFPVRVQAVTIVIQL